MRIIEIQNAPDSVNLVENERLFLQIQQQINSKRNFLLEQQKRIEKIKKQNEFLDNVRRDYSRYNNYIVNERQQQINAFTSLNQYLNDLTKSGNLSKNNIKDAKMEQKKILQQIQEIKQGLDEIIKET